MLRKVLIYLFYVGLVLGLLFGTPGIVSRLLHGHTDANYGSIVTWGLWVAAYIYFIGLSAGAFLVSSLVFVFGLKRFEKIGRLAILTAIVTLLMALLAIGLDLGHLGRSWHVYIWPNFSSPMAWMIWLYTGYMLLLFTEAYFLMRADAYDGRMKSGLAGLINRILSIGVRSATEENRTNDMRIVRILATIGVPLATMFHGGVGALFGVLASRPLWHSGLYPILFLLSAIVSGGAAITLLAYLFLHRDPERWQIIRSLGLLVLGVLAFELLWEFAEIGVYMYGRMPSHTAAWNVIMSGPYPWIFWLGQVGFGGIIPLVLLLIGLRRQWTEGIALACISIAIAFFAVRLNIVIPALSVEEISGLTAAYFHSRWTTAYVPSLMEWQVMAFIIGVGGVLLSLGWRYLPLRAEGPAAPSAKEAITNG
jgi:molybdopterin-containing oxidoreductase family membrane subunit